MRLVEGIVPIGNECLQTSMQAVELLDAKYGDFKTMARLMNPSPPNPSQEESSGKEGEGAGGFGYPCLMALRLRASQKQVAWEVMLSLLASEG